MNIYQPFPLPYGQTHSSSPILLNGDIDEQGLQLFLTAQGWPPGLQKVAKESMRRCPVRFFIVDDSGSMLSNDGHKLVVQGHTSKVIPCSRWTELTESLRFHAGLANAAKAITEFRLLNGAPPVVVGRRDDGGQGLSAALAVFSLDPSGGTPLCRHIQEVTTHIRIIEHELRAAGQKAVLVIATDGESSDGNIRDALKPLHMLPVWVVVRLCTDDSKIGDYWNQIDEEIELEMDVIDDLRGEAAEVKGLNPWLTYAEPIHQMREFGIIMKEFDLLDERSLSHEQIRSICTLLLTDADENLELPHPDMDAAGFVAEVKSRLARKPKVWSPSFGNMQPWIQLGPLSHALQESSCNSKCLLS